MNGWENYTGIPRLERQGYDFTGHRSYYSSLEFRRCEKSLGIGIVGLPDAGKSTVFNALTGEQNAKDDFVQDGDILYFCFNV